MEAPGASVSVTVLGRKGEKGDVEAPAAPDAVAMRPAVASTQPTVSFWGLFRYATRQDKLTLAAGLVAAAISGALIPVFTIVLGELINAIGDPTKDLQEEVNRNVLRLLYLGIAALAMGYVEVSCCTISGTNQANHVRAAYLENILRQDIRWYDTDGSGGKVLQGLNDDIGAFQAALSDRLGNFVRNLTTTAAGLIIAFIRGWQLTLVIMACMPALMFVSMAISMVTRKLQAQVAASNARATNLAQQALTSIKTVSAYGMEPSVATKYDKELDAPEAAGIRQGFMSGLVMGATNGVFFCSIALGIWYGALKVADGTYNGGEVINILMAGIIGGWSLGQAMPHLTHFQLGAIAATNLFAMITRKPEVDVDAPGMSLQEVRGDIELENIDFCYPARPDKRIFDGFSLTIPAGTTVALVGESGSGKSTIIQLIERFYDPAAGQVLLDGHNIKTLQLRWLRSQIALVSQEPTLFDTSIFTNIASSKPGATEEEVTAAATAANAHGFIMRLPNGYDTKVGEKGGQLSGGQRQRIAIARAILRNPKVLLLDEATSALDAQSEQAVQQALTTLMNGRTTVVVAHRLSTIINADDIAVVCGGKVIEHGTHEELLTITGGFYAGMVARQRMANKDDEAAARSDDEEGGLRKKFSNKQAKSAKPVLRQSILKRTSVRLSVIPQDILKKLSRNAKEQEADPDGVDSSFSRLFKINRPEWGLAGVGVASSCALGGQMPGFALAMAGITQVYFQPDTDDIKSGGSKWGLIFVGIGLGSMIANTLQGWTFGVMGQRLARRVRVMYLKAVLRQDMGWFDSPQNSSGEVMSRLTSDTAALRGAVGDAMGVMAQNLSMVVIGLAIAFSSSWSLALVITAVLPLMVFAQVVQASQTFGGHAEGQEGVSRANNIAMEAISAIRVVSAYSLQSEVLGMYKQNVGNKASNKSAHFAGLAFGVSQLILFLVFCLAFWFGGREVSKGNISFEDMMKAFNAIFFVAMGMSSAGAQFPEIGKAGPAAQRVFSLIDSTPKIDNQKVGAEPMIDGDIELKSVTFAYPARPGRLIFKEFNLRIPAGTSCALVGESGHGKSTIVGLLERFYDPLDGQVLIDGLSVQKLGLKYLRSQIGLVGQEPIMFSTSILENIRIGNPGATMSQVVEAARISNSLAFIEKLPEAYDTFLGEGGIQLSGGQKQRIAIARAVLRNPRVLMLDEATAALDAESERLVQEALDVVMVGRTSIVIAHRLSTIVNCNKIAAIYRGRVLEEGTNDELMKLNGYYAYLVAASST